MNLATSHIFQPLSIHPLFLLGMGLICGIFIQCIWGLSLFSLAVIALSTAFIIFLSYYLRLSIRLALIFASIGLLCGLFRMQQQIAQQKYKIDLFCNKPVDCIGTIVDMQISHDYATKNRLTLNIEKFRLPADENWTQFDAKIFVYCKKQPIDLELGDTISFSSIIARHTESNKSFNNYLLKEDVAATVFLQKATYSIVHRERNSFKNWIFAQRNRLVDQLRNKFSSNTFALFTSLFLGNRNEEKREQERVAQQSKNWGTSHHLARSGLHLVIFIYLLALLLRFFPIPLVAKDCLLLALCTTYHIFSWSSVSFARAFITFLCYKACSLLGLPSHVLHILTITCAVILIINPIQLFFLDFQLSFGLTFILAWFNWAYQAQTTQ